MNEKTVFEHQALPSMRSGVDHWVALALGTSTVVSLWAAIALMLVGGIIGWLIAIPTLLLGAGLPLSMLVHTVYRLEENHLKAESGPFRWHVAYRDIRSVSRSQTFIAGPALSGDRLLIDYGPMRYLIISPRDPEAFQHALQKRMNRFRLSRPDSTE